MKSLEEYETIDRYTDLLIFKDGSCFFQRYPDRVVSIETYPSREEAIRNFNLGEVYWRKDERD